MRKHKKRKKLGRKENRSTPLCDLGKPPEVSTDDNEVLAVCASLLEQKDRQDSPDILAVTLLHPRRASQPSGQLPRGARGL